MAPKYKLTYFAITGLGEPIRFLLSYMGEDFEDNRIQFADWPASKPTTPYGKVPYLEFDGKCVCQSAAISRYLGKKAGLAGADEWEDLQIDMAVDIFRDLIQGFTLWFTEKDSTLKETKKENLVTNDLPFYLGKLENLVKENGGYLANKKLSWGDIFFAGFIDFAMEQPELKIDLKKYPNLNNLFTKVFNIPRIKAWVDKRPGNIKKP